MAGQVRALVLSGLLFLPGVSPAGEPETGNAWLTAGISAGLVGAAFLGDRSARDWAREHQNGRADNILTSAEMMGQWQVAIPAAALYAGGMAFESQKAKDAVVSAALASAIGPGLVTQALKYSIGRARPRQDLGILHVRPFSGDVSFPSGHTAQAFSFASAVSETCQSLWVSVPLYAAATLTGIARIYHDAHFLSDVTAGAVIGTLSGVYSARYIRGRTSRDKVVLAPFYDSGAPGLAVSAGF